MRKLLFVLLSAIAMLSCTRSIDKDGGLVIDATISNPAGSRECVAVITSRVNAICENNPVVRFDSASGQLHIELPMEQDNEYYRMYLLAKGDFVNCETYELTELYQSLLQVNQWMSTNGILLNPADSTLPNSEYPLFHRLRPSVTVEGEIMSGPACGYCAAEDTAVVGAFLRKEEVTRKLPSDLRFLWSVKPNNGYFELIATKVMHSDRMIRSEMIEKAESVQGYSGMPEISMQLNKKYHSTWEKMTRENIGRSLAMVIDGRVYSYPRVQSEIREGRSSISGNFELQETKILAALLNSGPLPVPVTVTNIQYIQPK